ncbi:MAG: insulinase family protein [Acholeplasmataceae bacterium]|jgi:predicted Zn-dependent peptidase|nr:insulinase family protein [Acholeplasmataceae bacterium]
MIIHNTNKFKTIRVSIYFKEEIKKENIGLRAILPNLMISSTPTYKTRKALTLALENLYGATIDAKTTKQGKLSVMEFSLEFINPAFTTLATFNEALTLLHEIIYGHPNLPKKEFEIEKRLLIEKIKAYENDKTTFALGRMFEEMFKEERYGLRVNGKIEDVEPLTYQNVNSYYKKSIASNDCDVLLSGDLSPEIIKLVENHFKGRSNKQLNSIDFETKLVETVKNISEYDKISQTKLNIGYRFPVLFSDQDYYTAVLFNTTLGGAVHSRLFTNVREKHSLCYYIASRYDANKGISYIYSGVDKDRVDLALKVINEQIADLKENIVTEEELNLSKKSIINRLKELEDNQRFAVNNLYQQVLSDEIISLEERILLINQVKPEEVLKVAKKLEEDTVYLLWPEEKQ